MELELRAPVFVAPRPGEPVEGGGVVLVHAAIWGRLEAPSWGETWDLHLQLVGERGGDVWSWRRVDLAGRPLITHPMGGLHPPGSGDVSPAALDSLAAWIAAFRTVVRRSPETGLVSLLDEPSEAFRRRVLAALRPSILEALGRGGPTSADLTAELNRLAAGIEELELALSRARMLKVTAGLLVVPSRHSLPAAGPTPDPMLAGTVRARR